jgi:hypothetical protein
MTHTREQNDHGMVGAALFAYRQLKVVMGEAGALSIVRGCLDDVGLIDTLTPDDALLFANQLARHGGFVEIVARTLRIQAILAGAHM